MNEEIEDLKKQLAELARIVHEQSLQLEDVLAVFQKYGDTLEKIQLQLDALRQ